MKRLLSKLRHKLGGSPETPIHPDLSPPSDWDAFEPEGLPGISQGAAGSTSEEAAKGGPWGAIEDNVHPDMRYIQPQICSEKFPHNSPEEVDIPGYQRQPANPETITEFETEKGVPAPKSPDPGLISPSPDPFRPIGKFDPVELDDEYDDLIADDDEFVEQADELWEAVLPYEVGEELERARTDGALFEAPDLDGFSEVDLREFENEIENEIESAQWEDLLDLDLYEEGPDLPFPFLEEEDITSGQLDDYAARLVSQMRALRLDQRSMLLARLKSVLEEFPFSSSYRALSGLVQAGNSLEELEDACELKCLWREAPWLWSHRKFNKMQSAWETEERPSYRSALTWKLALTLIHRVGRVEAERRMFDDWRREWLEMQLEHSSDGFRIDPRFWSYPAFLNLNDATVELADSETWFYEEPIDVQPWNSFRLEDSEGPIWRFEPKEER